MHGGLFYAIAFMSEPSNISNTNELAVNLSASAPDELIERTSLTIVRVNNGPNTFRGSVVLAGVLIGLPLIGLIICLVVSFGIFYERMPSAASFVAVPIVLLIIWLLIVWFRSRNLKRAHIIADAVERISKNGCASIVQELAQSPLFSSGEKLWASYLATALVETGRMGETIVGYFKKEPAKVTPLLHYFEPRLLDESDEAFDAMAVAVENEGTPSDVSAADSPARRKDKLILRRIGRRLKSQGSWFFALYGSLQLIDGLVESIRSKTVTWRLGIWSVVVFIFVLRMCIGMSEGSQALLIPGGLLWRRIGSSKAPVKLHVFDRRNAVLCAMEMKKGLYQVYVADATESLTMNSTKREIEMLLRAWMSPLAPPRVEELSDFA